MRKSKELCPFAILCLWLVMAGAVTTADKVFDAAEYQSAKNPK